MKMLSLLPLVVFALTLFPVHGHAFFSDKKIDLVQESTFKKSSNVMIEKALDNYNLCQDGDWRSQPDDGKHVVTYRCQYDTPLAIKNTLVQQGIVDPQVQEMILNDLQEQDFALDMLLTFAIDDKVEHFNLAKIALIHKGSAQELAPETFSTHVESILQKKPLSFLLEGKAGNIFNYTTHKHLLSAQKEYQNTQSHMGTLPDSFQGKGSISLVSKLNDLVFNDKDKSITATLTMDMVATPSAQKTDDSGYFLKYFKSALGPRPVVLYSESLPVQLIPQGKELRNIHFTTADNKAQIFFEKKDLTAPKAIRIEYVHAYEDKDKHTEKKNPSQTVAPAATDSAPKKESPEGTPQVQPEVTPPATLVVAPEVKKEIPNIVGNYGYNAQGMEGSARIQAIEGKTDSVQVNINTVNVQALHLCHYDGICTYEDDSYICIMSDKPTEGMQDTFEILPAEDGFTIANNPPYLCGARGFLNGDYSRCEEASNGPLSMMVIPVEIIHEDENYIARFSDDGSESVDFVSKEQAEFLETMIGKKVLVHYNKNQIWDEEKNFCKRSKEIIAISDASLAEVQLLGGYSHTGENLRGYAFIEPNFENQAVFNVHLNNYSKDLKDNCQFAGECYPEGHGFICKSLDQDQKEFFEILPTEQGFMVPKNTSNTCQHSNFMSGKYNKCENINYGMSSISGTLLEIDQDNFAETTMIIDSYGNKILVILSKEQMALAQSFVGKKIFVSYEDKQSWNMHDRACVREKQLISISDAVLIQKEMMGNYLHTSKGVQGSAILSPIPSTTEKNTNTSDANKEKNFNLELHNTGLVSQETCSFTGICSPGGLGFSCQSTDKERTEFLTLVPEKGGFSVALSLSSSCTMKGIRSGKYTKCTEQTLNAGTVSGTLASVQEEKNGQIYFVVKINDKEMPFTMTHGRLDFIQQLIGKKVLVNYKDQQKWQAQEKLCQKVRSFTSIKEVK